MTLIGLSLAEFGRIVGAKPEKDVDSIIIDDEPQQVFEFDKVEAQVWVKEGRVVTVICGARDEDSDRGEQPMP